MNRIAQDILVTAIVKGRERYIWMWTETNRDRVLNTIGRFAADPGLSLTWGDAAMLSQKIREQEARL